MDWNFLTDTSNRNVSCWTQGVRSLANKSIDTRFCRNDPALAVTYSVDHQLYVTASFLNHSMSVAYQRIRGVGRIGMVVWSAGDYRRFAPILRFEVICIVLVSTVAVGGGNWRHWRAGVSLAFAWRRLTVLMLPVPPNFVQLCLNFSVHEAVEDRNQCALKYSKVTQLTCVRICSVVSSKINNTT